MSETNQDIQQRVIRAKYLYEAKQAHEAIELIRECILLEPKNESHRIQLALYLRAIGNFDESLFYVDKVSPSVPGYALLKGWHLIREGHFNAGMQMREPEIGVYRTDSLYPFPTEKKYVKGTPLVGKKVLLVLEGGNGDEIAYLRFAQTLSKLGAIVAAATSEPFVALASRTLCVSKAFAQNTVDHTWYDYYIPAMSMFSLFDISNPSDGIVFPYISVDEHMSSQWSAMIEKESEGKTKIGIQWQGNPAFDHVEFKTLPAKLLASFAQFGKLFLIQRHETLTPDNMFPTDVPAFNTQTEAPNWEQTLAVINGMDWIIAGDTTITHMAGALCKNAIVLLPHAPHPYWADLKEVSTWYPSVIVCRQKAYNDWESATQDAVVKLK